MAENHDCVPLNAFGKSQVEKVGSAPRLHKENLRECLDSKKGRGLVRTSHVFLHRATTRFTQIQQQI